MIDNLFLLAVGALGWGLSLATYSLLARRLGWPMGAIQVDFPAVPVLLGIVALCVGLWFAAVRGGASGGWVILLFGALLAIFWTGFLRVGSQISLILAPLASLLLIAGWLAEPLGYERASWTGESGTPAAEAVPDDRPGYRIKPSARK